jgi:hypothetical protein
MSLAAYALEDADRCVLWAFVESRVDRGNVVDVVARVR